MLLNIGDKAPDLHSQMQMENQFLYQILKEKKVVLWFFPKASTPG